ncbi:MAG: B12-binding domain-containing radical SAM protein [Roseburia sp.]
MKKKILLTAINAKYIHSNLAVYSLRAYAKDYQENIELAEYTINNRLEQILTDVYKRQPDVLCFSCYIWNLELVVAVAEEFHKLKPEVPIWVGGPEVSYETEAFLQKYPFFTGVMMGEGEKVFTNLCAYYLTGEGTLNQLLGISFRNGEKICVNQWETELELSTIPFCYDHLEDFSNRIIYYESSRGCPFRCSYCLSSIDKTLRFRDPELVKRELQFFLDHKVAQVKFVDRTFNCRKDYAIEIWNYIKEHDNGVTNFHFEVAADLMTPEEMELMSDMRVGLIQLEIGVQTTFPKTIEEIHRRMDLEQVKAVVRQIQGFGNIHQHLDLIAGLPYEGYDDFRRSFDEVYELKPEQLQLGFLKVLKGSYLYEHADDYQLVYQGRPPYEVLKTRWLSYEDICRIKLAEEMLEVYYNSGQFAKSIRLLEQFFDSAYGMFEELGFFYERRGYLNMSHSRQRRGEILLEFAREHPGGAGDVFEQALTFDIYSRENAKSRPSWAADCSRWKEVSHRICQKGKLSHVERFDYEFLDESQLGQKAETYYVLFDYEDRDPRTNQAAVRKCEDIEE